MKRKFYTICNPTLNNENTGNYCININDLAKFDKDFIFNGVVISKKIVRDNLKTIFIYKEDKKGNYSKIPIYIITKEIIERYGEAV